MPLGKLRWLGEELIAVGLDPAELSRVETLTSRHGHRVVRVWLESRSFILKSFTSRSEVPTYNLLRDLGVPTLSLLASADRSMLLEDLAASSGWHAAGSDDLRCAEAGEAVARWYRILHDSGRQVAADPPDFLARDVDVLSSDGINELARALQFVDRPAMKRASESIEALKKGLQSLPQTLNHNDFYWTNLALSRGDAPRRAVVYDYHLMGVGPACCDYRNVLSVLEGDAAAAFRVTYGSLPEEHFILDRPVATLYALHEATRQPAFPRWAEALVDQVRSGEFEENLRAALILL